MREQIIKLQREMESQGIDFYLVSTADAHNSEYVGAHDKVREFLSGFTGSNGDLLVGRDNAYLWTDGRYFVQAAGELEGSGIELMKMGEPEVPTIEEFIGSHIKSGDTLGFDGAVITAEYIDRLTEKSEGKEIRLSGVDLAGKLWSNRPDRSCNPVIIHDIKYAGEDRKTKLERVRNAMKKEGCDYFFLSRLDDIMWLLNIRGSDVECNPVALCFCLVCMDRVLLFVQSKAVNKEVEEKLSCDGVCLCEYEKVHEILGEYEFHGRVMLDKKSTGYSIYSRLKGRCGIKEADNPTELMKAVRNKTEIENMKKYFLKDSVAMTKYLYWLWKCRRKGCRDEAGNTITEFVAARKCDSLREEQEDFQGVSFPTICAYGANAAMMHYEAEEESCSRVEDNGFLLTDCGGQYPGATTDVTRTSVMGRLTKEQIRDYTLTLKGMLNLQEAVFLQGCSGKNLDILARIYLWRAGRDYKCGTGHGVGFFLNVHEGPQNIRWRYVKTAREAELLPGMIVTDEPGVYIENGYGIRIENTLMIVEGEKNTDGQFLGFEPLTLVPIDKEAVDVNLLGEEGKEWLNRYHQRVYAALKDYLEGEELEWLSLATSAI